MSSILTVTLLSKMYIFSRSRKQAMADQEGKAIKMPEVSEVSGKGCNALSLVLLKIRRKTVVCTLGS